MSRYTKTSTIEWGWRATCAHLGCARHLERWSDEGTPALEYWQLEEGWTYAGGRTGRDYKWFCPDHSGPAKAYKQEKKRWDKAKREVAKTTWRSFLPNWAAHTLEAIGLGVRESVLEWEEKNPRPKAPWEVTQ